MLPRHRLTATAVLALASAASCGGTDALNADAGSDFSVSVGEAPSFDGCASGGDIANYKWVLQSTPENMTEDVGKPLREVEGSCSFTLEDAMVTDELGQWQVELTISDAAGNEDTDTVVVEVVD